MTRKQYSIAALATAAVVAGALVVYNVSKPKEYVYYFPVMYSHHETLICSRGAHKIRTIVVCNDIY